MRKILMVTFLILGGVSCGFNQQTALNDAEQNNTGYIAPKPLDKPSSEEHEFEIHNPPQDAVEEAEINNIADENGNRAVGVKVGLFAFLKLDNDHEKTQALQIIDRYNKDGKGYFEETPHGNISCEVQAISPPAYYDMEAVICLGEGGSIAWALITNTQTQTQWFMEGFPLPASREQVALELKQTLESFSQK